MMSAILRFNEPVTQEAQRALAKALGKPEGSAADAFEAFCTGLGLPTRLHEVNVGADSFELISQNTMTEFFIYNNPRKIRRPEEVLEILKLAA
jgi:maleylacetate reductase